MVKIGVHLRKLSQNKAGVPLFGPLCTVYMEVIMPPPTPCGARNERIVSR